jgi:hypothetical protein
MRMLDELAFEMLSGQARKRPASAHNLLTSLKRSSGTSTISNDSSGDDTSTAPDVGA